MEFDYEQAKLGNLYTQGAFLLCKRLEFKNLLGRFDSENAQPQQQLQEFFSCSDLSGCETLFDKAAKQEYVGVSLVAEGAETQAQVAFLQENGCDYIQGYYYSKPVPETKFCSLLDSGAPLPELDGQNQA